MHAEIDSLMQKTGGQAYSSKGPYLNENSGNGGFYLLPVNAQGGLLWPLPLLFYGVGMLRIESPAPGR